MLLFRNYLVFFVVLSSLAASGWDNHSWITQEALSSIPEYQGRVAYHSLEESLAKTDLPYRDVASLLKALKLNSYFTFASRLGENKSPGSFLISDVISRYSDEPDWGCDQNLFDTGEFPELWTEDSAYISKRNGTGSQGFRHMYFPGQWSWHEPIGTIQIPQHAIGEAPYRAEIFYNLAAKLLEKGDDYWGYRFMGWSLHFIEDLHQPFHTRQIPSTKFIRLKWKWAIPSLDVAASAEQIIYYHFSYERWMAEEMAPSDSELRKSLRSSDRAEKLEGSPADYVKTYIVSFSSKKGNAVGSKMTQIFPKFTPTPELSAEAFVGSEEWTQTLKKPGPMKPLLETTNELFVHMGNTIRSWTDSLRKNRSALNSQP